MSYSLGAMHGTEMNPRRWVEFSLLIAISACGLGCAKATTSTLPTLEEATRRLSDLQPAIIQALENRNPSASDEELHQAMYLSDHLADIAAEEGVSPHIVQRLRPAAKTLFDALVSAHDGSHGGGDTNPEDVLREVKAGFAAVQAAVGGASGN